MRTRGSRVLMLITMLLSLRCVQSTGPVVPELKVCVEDVSCVEAWLRVEVKGVVAMPTFVVMSRYSGGREEERDTVMVYRSDTVVVDEGLEPGREYRYCVQWMGKEQTVQVRTMDTTSHAIQWYIDTLGAVGIIRDVWILRRDLAYVVGEICVRDSTGAIDWEHIYNAARWNGHEWELMRIPFIGSCSAVDYPPIKAIWAFSPTNILVTNGGSIVTYDGVNATMDCRMNSLLTGAINKIWAENPENVYLVGNNGLIAHYDGSKWERVASGTEVDLTDIYGIDGNHIWVAGANWKDAHSVVLAIDRTRWRKIYDSGEVPWQEWYEYTSLWTDSDRYVYLAGKGQLRRLDLRSMRYTTINTGQQYISYCVRGLRRNDIFVTGQNSEVVHFNGISWDLYEEIQIQTENNVWWRCIDVRNDVVIAGGDYYVGLYSAPIVLRGYR